MRYVTIPLIYSLSISVIYILKEIKVICSLQKILVGDLLAMYQKYMLLIFRERSLQISWQYTTQMFNQDLSEIYQIYTKFTCYKYFKNIAC